MPAAILSAGECHLKGAVRVAVMRAANEALLTVEGRLFVFAGYGARCHHQ